MKTNTNKLAPLEESADTCMNSLILVSFVKIILIQKIFNVNNINFFVITFIFMVLLLFKRISKILRMGVSMYSLYLFFTETSERNTFLSYAMFLVMTYFLLYLILRRALFKKNIDSEVISNSLALVIFIKIIYSYFVIIFQYFHSDFIFAISLFILLVLLLIPVLEDLGRLIIAFFATADVLYYLYKLSSLFTITFLILVIIVLGSLNYKLRNATSI